MMQKIKKLLGIKTCEHKWVVDSVVYRFCGSGWFEIFKYCSVCGRKLKLVKSVYFLDSIDRDLGLDNFLKGIKQQNPEYYVIGVED